MNHQITNFWGSKSPFFFASITNNIFCVVFYVNSLKLQCKPSIWQNSAPFWSKIEILPVNYQITTLFVGPNHQLFLASINNHQKYLSPPLCNISQNESVRFNRALLIQSKSSISSSLLSSLFLVCFSRKTPLFIIIKQN